MVSILSHRNLGDVFKVHWGQEAGLAEGPWTFQSCSSRGSCSIYIWCPYYFPFGQTSVPLLSDNRVSKPLSCIVNKLSAHFKIDFKVLQKNLYKSICFTFIIIVRKLLYIPNSTILSDVLTIFSLIPYFIRIKSDIYYVPSLYESLYQTLQRIWHSFFF